MKSRTCGRTGHGRRLARTSGVTVQLASLLACCPFAHASAQSLDIGQYAHTAWTVQDGAPGAVRNLAQGVDGVLWIASERGLFQFDGVRFERFEPPPGQALLPYGVHNGPTVLVESVASLLVELGALLEYGHPWASSCGALSPTRRERRASMLLEYLEQHRIRRRQRLIEVLAREDETVLQRPESHRRAHHPR